MRYTLACVATRWQRAATLSAVLGWAIAGFCVATSEPGATVSDEIRVIVEDATAPDSHLLEFAEYRAALARFYRDADYTPQWVAAEQQGVDVAVAFAELRAASSRGLQPEDYNVDWLSAEVDDSRVGALPQASARADVAMTLAMLRYLSDLHNGRGNPRRGEIRFAASEKTFDVVAFLRAALDQNWLAAAVDTAQPALPIYRRLQSLLVRYRELAQLPWPALPPLPAKVAKIKPGDAYDGIDALRERLVLLGDLAADISTLADTRYAGALVDALQRFQERHGLQPDGVLGKQTLATLNVSPEYRLQQIELSLEQLRWLPDRLRGPLIAVNIPSFRLWAFAGEPAGDRSELTMPVIDGRAMRMPTPVFVGEMRYIEFNPCWNVPPSILHKEIVPMLARDPSYLQREDMELVGADSNAQPITAINDETLADVSRSMRDSAGYEATLRQAGLPLSGGMAWLSRNQSTSPATPMSSPLTSSREGVVDKTVGSAAHKAKKAG